MKEFGITFTAALVAFATWEFIQVKFLKTKVSVFAK
jgi:hypothetical protein